MYREVRRDLIVTIDRADLDRPGTRRMFMQRGHREFFGKDYPEREGPKELLIDFIRYFSFDAGGDEAQFNGFQPPWFVLLALCGPRDYHVHLRDSRAFCEALAPLVRDPDSRWPSFGALLDRELIQTD